jgi:hypothetical protein
MSVARRVVEVEQIHGNWLTIEDEDDRAYHYAKRGIADVQLPAHVECLLVPGKRVQATLVRDRKGKTTLRQDNQGLPEKIGVACAEFQAIPVTWGDTLQYELVVVA